MRGILCKSCNWGIGSFRDNIHFIEAAIRYLLKEHLLPALVPSVNIFKMNFAQNALNRNCRREYGITLFQRQWLCENQNYVCKICDEPLKNDINLDHCHCTGQIRGILC